MIAWSFLLRKEAGRGWERVKQSCNWEVLHMGCLAEPALLPAATGKHSALTGCLFNNPAGAIPFLHLVPSLVFSMTDRYGIFSKLDKIFFFFKHENNTTLKYILSNLLCTSQSTEDGSLSPLFQVDLG